MVDDPRLQQRSVKREATTPARRKMTVDTQNPMVGAASTSGAPLTRGCCFLSRSLEIAWSGKETRQARPRDGERRSCCQPRHVLLDRDSFTGSRWTCMRCWAGGIMGQARPLFCCQWWTRPCFETETEEVLRSKKKTATDFLLLQILHTIKKIYKFKDGDARSKKKNGHVASSTM